MNEHVHSLKTWPVYFDAVLRGDKNFEVRKNDRDFQRGHLVQLTWFDPDNPASPYWGTPLIRRITYVLHGGQFGIEPGYVVLGLEHVEDVSIPVKDEI